jgi:hypothetical protein
VPASRAPLRNFSLMWETRSRTAEPENLLPPTDQPPSWARPTAAFQVGRGGRHGPVQQGRWAVVAPIITAQRLRSSPWLVEVGAVGCGQMRIRCGSDADIRIFCG